VLGWQPAITLDAIVSSAWRWHEKERLRQHNAETV